MRALEHTKFNFKFPWCSLGVNLKGRHNFIVTEFGHSVKWPQFSTFRAASIESKHKPEDILKFFYVRKKLVPWAATTLIL